MSVQSQLVCFIQEIKGFTIKVLQLCCVVKYSLKYILSRINSSGKQSKLRKNITSGFSFERKNQKLLWTWTWRLYSVPRYSFENKWKHSNNRSLQKTNRLRTATPFPKTRRQQIQERPGVNTMVNRVYRLSSTNEGFAKECNKLCTMFSKLRYPKTLVDSTINKFSQGPDKKYTPCLQ